MSESTSVEPGKVTGGAADIRMASHDDVPAVAGGVEELLVELGGKRPPPAVLETEAQALLDDPEAGALLVADAAGEIVGVLAASWQRAMHVPGRYALIQDLWVHRDWRSRAIGADLVGALAELARACQVSRIEVGLPRETFAGLGATEAFYGRNGFENLGIRMRRILP